MHKRSIFFINQNCYETTFAIYKNETISYWYELCLKNKINNFSLQKLILDIKDSEKYIVKLNEVDTKYLINFNTKEDIEKYLNSK